MTYPFTKHSEKTCEPKIVLWPWRMCFLAAGEGLNPKNQVIQYEFIYFENVVFVWRCKPLKRLLETSCWVSKMSHADEHENINNVWLLAPNQRESGLSFTSRHPKRRGYSKICQGHPKPLNLNLKTSSFPSISQHFHSN